jgi:hypothetical protein
LVHPAKMVVALLDVRPPQHLMCVGTGSTAACKRQQRRKLCRMERPRYIGTQQDTTGFASSLSQSNVTP